MCHVTRLSVVNRERLSALPTEYRQKLEDALENEGYVASTRAAVTPIFERVYAAWQERQAALAAVREDRPRRVATLTPTV